MNTAKESALQKELSRSRSKGRILENLIQNGCDLRGCPFSVSPVDGWKAPKIKYGNAGSFRAIGTGDRFVVYGNNMSKITESANFYSKEKYDAPAEFIKIESQTHLCRTIDRDGAVGEVIGIYPYSEESEKTTYIVSHQKGHWILGADELSKIKDFEIEIDWDSSEYGLDGESERDLSLNAN